MNEVVPIQNKIYEIRGQRVMLDRDLAELYGVTTGALNQAENKQSWHGNTGNIENLSG